MGIVFGLLAAATYGGADFLGGRASRRADVFTVVLVSQLIGAAPIVAVVPFFLDLDPTVQALAWGAAAGLGGGAGVLMLYRGLAVGRMSVIAPVTGVIAAVAPVVFGLAIGERPGRVALVGVVIALISVVLVSATPPPPGAEDDVTIDATLHRWRTPGVSLALGAGLSFGAFFIFLDAAGDASGVWPLIGMRTSSILLVAVVALFLRKPWKPPGGTLGTIAAAGLLDVSANVLYLLATRRGLLTLVAVLTSMYPAMTVVLARVVLNERFVRTQVAGLLFAAASIVLIVLG